MKKKSELQEHNPFTESLIIKAIWRENKSYIQHTGVNVSLSLMDADPHTSVYTERTLSLFKELNGSAKDMFIWVCSKLTYGQDYLEIREGKYCEEMGVSRPTFQSARNALLNRVIAPRKLRSHTYYINPSYFYRGRRVEAYPNNILVKSAPKMVKLEDDDIKVSGDNLPLQVPGMEIPDMFGDVASLGPDRT